MLAVGNCVVSSRFVTRNPGCIFVCRSGRAVSMPSGWLSGLTHLWSLIIGFERCNPLKVFTFPEDVSFASFAWGMPRKAAVLKIRTGREVM